MENTVVGMQPTKNIGSMKKANGLEVDVSMGKETTQSSDQDELMSKESSKTLKVQLPDDVTEFIIEC